MKTLILKSADNSIRAELKVDIFATTDEMQEPGFDTRFTGMEVIKNEDTTASGVDLRELEHNWRSVVALAEQYSLALYVIDLNDDSQGAVEILAAG